MVILVTLFRVCLFLGGGGCFCLFVVFCGGFVGEGLVFFCCVCVCFKMIWPTTNIVDRCYGIVSCVVYVFHYTE